MEEVPCLSSLWNNDTNALSMLIYLCIFTYIEYLSPCRRSTISADRLPGVLHRE